MVQSRGSQSQTPLSNWTELNWSTVKVYEQKETNLFTLEILLITIFPTVLNYTDIVGWDSYFADF